MRATNYYLAFAMMIRSRIAIALVLIAGVPLVSASARADFDELRRDRAEAPSGREGRAQQPQPRAPGRAPGGGPRGAEPLVIDDTSGFQPIFDGKTLKGWDGDPAFWKVADGAIVGQSTPENAVKETRFSSGAAASQRTLS